MRPCFSCESGPGLTTWLAIVGLLALVLVWRHRAGLSVMTRSVLTVVCVIFVGAGLALSLLRDPGSPPGSAPHAEPTGLAVPAAVAKPAEPENPAETASTVESPSATITTVATITDAQPPATAPSFASVIVYYFHRTIRCETCLRIEEWGKQAVEEKYNNELASGILEWQVVNVDQPEHAHFVKEFNLTAQGIVLVRPSTGAPPAFRNLESVWDLVGDLPRFTEYVQNEVSSFLAAGDGQSRPSTTEGTH